MPDDPSEHADAELFQRIFHGHPDGVLVVDGHNRVVTYNRRFAEVCGVATASPVPAGQAPAPTPSSFAEGLPTAVGTPGRWDEMTLPDGRTLERHCTIVEQVGGVRDVRVWYFRDVTARKAAEESLSGQLSELRRWQDVMLDREWRMVGLKREVNELCARLGGPIRYPSQAPESDGQAVLKTTSESPRVTGAPAIAHDDES
jgi:hypothetical protein